MLCSPETSKQKKDLNTPFIVPMYALVSSGLREAGGGELQGRKAITLQPLG